MNTPTLLQQCLDEGLLAEVWGKVCANGGAPGVDGVSVEQFRRHALSRLERLRAEVLKQTYRPQPLLQVNIPKDDGRLRHLAIPTVRDRVLQTAVARVLTERLDPEFDDASFAYRSGRSVRQAVARIIDCRDQGLAWVVDADIREFFDCIDHSVLFTALRHKLPDASLNPLLAQWLAAPVMENGELRPRRRGVPQGSPLSPLLANLYLHPLDQALHRGGYTLVRYADDFLVLCHSRVEAETALAEVHRLLAGLHLEINEEKTRITHFRAGFRFIGVRFEGTRVEAVEEKATPWVVPAGNRAASSHLLQAPTLPVLVRPLQQIPSGIEQETTIEDPETVRFEEGIAGEDLPGSVYITTQGVRLMREGERLVVARGQDIIARIPLHRLDEIVIHGNAMVSTAIIRHCHTQGLSLAFADHNGVSPALLDTTDNVRLTLLKQQVYRDDDQNFTLAVARSCVHGKLHNCRTLLRRFSRREPGERIARATSILERTLKQLDSIDDLNVLRGHEGRAARSYFAAFTELIPSAWRFNGRNRMPPRDPVNAMLSYGYAVLFHTVHAILLKARLHPGLGHLHANANESSALVCDLMEEFRPLLVDTVILTLVRKHSLDPDEDFVMPADDNAMCMMLPAAKQLLIARLEARMAAPVTLTGELPEDEKKISLYRLLRLQATRYARALAPAGTPYCPYLARV
ncbi:hypothetical protein AGMMS50256_17340 [Betaproteobacteria bacterium]|nr:hypothetical protein AGMMS50256_17340 [Betaproteobacteria bacterium]